MTPSRLSRFGVDVLCIGHRGARAFAPENTLAAVERAAELGCDMVEIDVHLTRDGEPVVHHDDRLGRCTDVAARYPARANAFLSEFSFDELRALDAGSWYLRELELPPLRRQAFLRTLGDDELARFIPPERRARFDGGQVRIPHLDELLDLARELGLAVNVEIKTIPRLYPGIAPRVLQSIRETRMERRVLVSSFDHQQLVEMRALDATLPLGVLTSDRLARPGRYLDLLDADAYHPGCADEFDSLGFGSVDGLLDARGIADVRAAGRGVFAWTCNDTAQMRQLAEAGACGVITDYPNRFPHDLRADEREA